MRKLRGSDPRKTPAKAIRRSKTLANFALRKYKCKRNPCAARLGGGYTGI